MYIIWQYDNKMYVIKKLVEQKFPCVEMKLPLSKISEPSHFQEQMIN